MGPSLRPDCASVVITPFPEGSVADEPGDARDAVDVEGVVAKELDYLLTHRHGQGDDRHRELVRRSLIGLALSGGGIRSATTNLGVLQALSRMNVLPMVDYVSTVSGGGYIGACLSSLLSWNGKSPAPGDSREHAFTFDAADRPRFTTSWHSFPFRAENLGRGLPVGSDVVAHLRTHGNFLIARWGLFRRETLRGIGNLLSGIVYNVALFLLTVAIITALYFSGARTLAPAMHSVLG